MSDTALIDEVRVIRRRIAEECGNDPVRIAKRVAEAAKRFLDASKTSESHSGTEAPNAVRD